MIFSPLDQFEIKPLITINNIITLSLTNYVIYLILVATIILSVLRLLNNTKLG
ncbi:uncharacterized protein PRCAT00006383001 [Priceomyces carsonii]|uniref:uncharacterized protein n=1 Tax=Priceomyces carsonii TaxID=28549 RepID=UPI002EDAF5D3|nr:unnamed protein product [Priceomyces carsonii]